MKKRKQSFTNPDLRRQTKVPAPPCEEIEQQLWKLLEPEKFTPMHLMKLKDEKKLRARVLTLPVMMAVVVSLVYRQIAGLTEVIRILSEEGLMWVEPIEVSAQALSKRLQTLPVELFAQIWQQVIERIRTSQRVLPIPPLWEAVHEKFTAISIADASTERRTAKET
ncbi:transposase [Kalymmatonema gypsitolerans NIES-4073]|nr:transposase [Scytonema sp. NIES-4073]